jgi:hypothetical protein
MCALDALQFDWHSLEYNSMMLTSRSADLFGASFGGSRMTMSHPWPASSAARRKVATSSRTKQHLQQQQQGDTAWVAERLRLLTAWYARRLPRHQAQSSTCSGDRSSGSSNSVTQCFADDMVRYRDDIEVHSAHGGSQHMTYAYCIQHKRRVDSAI